MGLCKDCLEYIRPKCIEKDEFTARKNTCDGFKDGKGKKNVKKDEK